MQQRFICIHGHFYQPPRENPWLESIDIQDSAYPFHDWNERIHEECYRPNAAARILDRDDRIVRIINNYSRISFNFGPTLLSWMAVHARDTYSAILEADRISRYRFSGHGSALAQVYNHPILPLCNERDRTTQVAWGIEDFRSRFGRAPEGMWLPETGVDLASLETLAAAGIRFTILAPNQAARWRGPQKGARWNDRSNGPVDTRRAYRVALPSGASMVVFFYDGEISQGIAFGGLLRRGDELTGRLASAFSRSTEPQLVHVATDGETYGHHHRFGDMALAWTLDRFENDDAVRLTNYGEFLERHPAVWQAEIHERTAWSCAHGLGRWTRDCGCNTGAGPGWKQTWREPLRAALDHLRDELDAAFEKTAGSLLKDPWAARNDYIAVVLNRNDAARDRFLDAHATASVTATDRLRIWGLMELQRQRMLMYTSCAWFFDEVSGIETVQVLQYATRALQLANEYLGYDGEARFVDDLRKVPSNVEEHPTAADIYFQKVRTQRIDPAKVAANRAAAALFGSEEPQNLAPGFEIEATELRRFENGRRHFVVGPVGLKSRTTTEAGRYLCAVLHLGDHNLTGGVRPLADLDDPTPLIASMERAFAEAEVPALLRILDREFESGAFALGDLFRDQQRQLLARVLDRILQDADSMYQRIYQPNAPLLKHLHRLNIPRPPALQVAADRVLNTELMAAIHAEPFAPIEIARLAAEVESIGAHLDREGLGLAASHRLESLVDAFGEYPGDLSRLERLRDASAALTALPVELRLHGAQNRFYRLSKSFRETHTTHGEAWSRALAKTAAILRLAAEAL